MYTVCRLLDQAASTGAEASLDVLGSEAKREGDCGRLVPDVKLMIPVSRG